MADKKLDGLVLDGSLSHPGHKHPPSYGRITLYMRKEKECGIRRAEKMHFSFLALYFRF